ncbi:MAG TPA: radical SAM protein [Candidatus Sumerlaeota bacterium]|nr:radical SAM protein [Candidatus Sumerlaeota bacterium]
MIDESQRPAERFAQAPRGDRSRPRLVRCLNPFRWLEVNEGGEVTPCCNTWFRGNLGSLADQTMEEIWNGSRYRALREAMYEGGDWGRFCNAETCPHIINDTWVPVDFVTSDIEDIAPITDEMLSAVREGRTELDFGPAQVGLACDPRCNLKCIMCAAAKNPDRSGGMTRRALDGLNVFLPTVRRIKMSGDGEVFVIPEMRDFLFRFNAEKYPQVEFLIHTNGLLLTSEMWDRIPQIRMDWLVVSIDAATRETYGRIRVGGDWDTLMRNLGEMSRKVGEGRVHRLMLSMTVMKSNHEEMVEFAKMGKRLGAHLTYFSPIIGDYAREQIFDHRDIGALLSIRRQMRDPVMNDPMIDPNALLRWKNWRPGWADFFTRGKYHLRRLKALVSK